VALRFAFVPFVVLAGFSNVSAEDSAPSAPQSMSEALSAQAGKSVTLRLHSGEELTGKLVAPKGGLLRLEALSGREFFDATIPLDAVEALIVRRPAK
jgi:hypothetical protein